MSAEPDTEAGDVATPSGDAASENGPPIPDPESVDDEGYVIGSGRSGIVRRIGHDDFDPVGTLVLIAIYMVIVGAMWIFMYFVEFLGGDLTVIG
nr:ba3-type terminal oxidase subunit CbaD [Halobellus rarus]